uniref:CTTNBP2 N-terminal like n=1 Tax=Nothobranchius kuhntae TaxID=321403 RepID=A0A1A8J0P7_NOTKU
MLEFCNIPGSHMKSKLNMESLTKPEQLMLFSILEGELEARDVVIEALKAQCRELFIQERYAWYNLSDPFHALQRDSEIAGACMKEPGHSTHAANPLVILKLVVSHCRRMQEKMMSQLAVTNQSRTGFICCIWHFSLWFSLCLQLEFERSHVRRLEKEQRRITEQLEEERAQHKQLSCALAKECKWASSRALEEGHRLTELSRKLDKEKEASQALRKELEEERRRSLRMEARVEEQLAEFDTEREQLRSRLKKEEAHRSQLQRQVEELKRKLEEGYTIKDDVTVEAAGREWVTNVLPGSSSVVDAKVEDIEQNGDNLPVNGHHCSLETNGLHVLSEKDLLQNGNSDPTQPRPLPCASPVLSKHPTGSTSPGSHPYQAGINQRFHAVRHRFQGTSDPEPQSQAAPAVLPLSPNIVSPVSSSSSPEPSPVKQMARSTVTQVLSRFTTAHQSAAAKLSTPNNSPFGTDYRSLAAPLSPVISRAAGIIPQGIRSPIISRVDRGNPPPIPPKKPGLAQPPLTPAGPKSANNFSESSLSGSCGLSSAQEDVKELDMVVSSN